MFTYRLLVLVSLMLVATILTSEAERAKADLFKYRRNRQAKYEVRQYCGRSLSTTVQQICGSAYHARFKKSNQEFINDETNIEQTHSLRNTVLDMDSYLYSNDVHPYKTVENAKKMLKVRRNPRGIYEECCLKSCTTEELRTYCANP